MKRILFAALVISTALNAQSQQKETAISIIPQPVSITRAGGTFTLPSTVTIIAPQNEELKKIALRFSEHLQTTTGTIVTIKEGKKAGDHSIFLSLSTDKPIPKEGYRLKITTDGASLTAAEPAGIFYGVPSLP